MLKFINKIFPPIVPVLFVDSKINQANCLKLLSKINNQQFLSVKALAIVVSIQNSMPVQIDKIVEKIKKIKKQFDIPVYAFCLDQCTSQSYYMASIADQIYALESTIFQLKGTQKKKQFQKLFASYGIKKSIQKSNQKTSSTFLDSFSAANTSYYMNQKQIVNLSQRLFKYSLENRFQKKNNSLKQSQYQAYKEMQNNVLCEIALKKGLVDNIGSYCDVLSKKYPDYKLKVIALKDEPIQIKKSIAIISSPILLFLFMFKVFLKYSIIMYLYLKSKTQKKSQQQLKNCDTNL